MRAAASFRGFLLPAWIPCASCTACLSSWATAVPCDLRTRAFTASRESLQKGSDETACSLRCALVKRYALAKGPLQDLRVPHARIRSHMIDSSHSSSSFSCSRLTCKSAQPTLRAPMHHRTFLTDTYPQVHPRAPLALQTHSFLYAKLFPQIHLSVMTCATFEAGLSFIAAPKFWRIKHQISFTLSFQFLTLSWLHTAFCLCVHGFCSFMKAGD